MRGRGCWLADTWVSETIRGKTEDEGSFDEGTVNLFLRDVAAFPSRMLLDPVDEKGERC